MIVIEPMPESLDRRLLDRLHNVDTATIGHFIESGAMDPGIRPVNRHHKIAGVAVTLSLVELDSALLHHTTGLLRPGDVLVIDRNGDHRHACLGGGVGAAVKVSGAGGAIIDGPCTDLNEVLELELGVWCRGVSPITTRNIGTAGAMNVPVNCGGVSVNAGDIILADHSGVLALPPNDVEALLARGEEKEQRSPLLRTALRDGVKMGDHTGATEKIEATLKAQNAAAD